MSDHQTFINRSKLSRFKEEGRGEGEKEDYEPWLQVSDQGGTNSYRHRILGWKTGRVHHLLSNLERDYFYLLEWSPQVIDIRDQYPLLPIEETIEIAQNYNLHHPIHPRTKEIVVMTTDFLVTTPYNQLQSQISARAVKPAAKLSGKTVIEKLEIERLYWQKREIDWGIVTEKEIPQRLAKNMGRFHGSYWNEMGLNDQELDAIEKFIRDVLNRSQAALRFICLDCDARFRLKEGTSLAAVCYLIAHRRLLIDMNTLFDAAKNLVLLDS